MTTLRRIPAVRRLAYVLRQAFSFDRLLLIAAVAASFALVPGLAEAGDDGTPLHGFLQGNYSVNTAEKNPDGGRYKWSQETLQLKLDETGDPYHLFIKADAFYDNIDSAADANLREWYADYTSLSWDLRAGRQIITWGLGDLVFINDVFPKDYEAFFAGRPIEYLKKGVDGVKLGIYPGFVSVEAVAIPYFEPNHFPNPNRFWMFDPMPGVQNRVTKKPEPTAGNTEVALRLYRDIAGYEAAIYYYNGYFRQPSLQPDNPNSPSRITLFYPRLRTYGASLQGRALDGVVSIEAGYYDSRQDKSGKDPFVPNSSAKFLVGYQRQVWEDFTVGLQYYAEHMMDYANYEKTLPAGFPKARRLHDLASVRLTQFLRYQTLKLSFFSFYSPADRDYLMNPEVNYKFTDNVWAAVGMNYFGGGKPWTQFGSLNNDDNAYLQLRREF